LAKGKRKKRKTTQEKAGDILQQLTKNKVDSIINVAGFMGLVIAIKYQGLHVIKEVFKMIGVESPLSPEFDLPQAGNNRIDVPAAASMAVGPAIYVQLITKRKALQIVQDVRQDVNKKYRDLGLPSLGIKLPEIKL
jgi:basic membrane lipoprotein Med (substrate-binding protein (PBP1-ABC) superfamily)